MYASKSRPATIQVPSRISSHIVAGFMDSQTNSVRETEGWPRTVLKNSTEQMIDKIDSRGLCNRVEPWGASIFGPVSKHKNYNKMSEETRKERNRRLAKEFRAKKKLELQLYQRWVGFLQERVNELQAENYKLRQLVADTSKDGNQESRSLSVGDNSKDHQPNDCLDRVPTAHPDLTLFSEAALTTRRHSSTIGNSTTFHVFDSNQNSVEKEYPLSPVSQQPSPFKSHVRDRGNWLFSERKEAIWKDSDMLEPLSTSDSSVLGIDSLVHF